MDTADDGIIAVDKIKKAKDEQYDLILMDIQMHWLMGIPQPNKFGIWIQRWLKFRLLP